MAVAIIALLATIATPSIKSFIPKDERKILLENLNSITATGLSNAILTGKINRVVFDLKNNKIYIQEQTGNKLATGALEYADISSKYASSEISLDTTLFDLKNFYIDSKDEMGTPSDEGVKERLWFYILPEGTCQVVILNFIDNTVTGEEDQFSFLVNPFTCQFKYYEKFMAP